MPHACTGIFIQPLPSPKLEDVFGSLRLLLGWWGVWKSTLCLSSSFVLSFLMDLLGSSFIYLMKEIKYASSFHQKQKKEKKRKKSREKETKKHGKAVSINDINQLISNLYHIVTLLENFADFWYIQFDRSPSLAYSNGLKFWPSHLMVV